MVSSPSKAKEGEPSAPRPEPQRDISLGALIGVSEKNPKDPNTAPKLPNDSDENKESSATAIDTKKLAVAASKQGAELPASPKEQSLQLGESDQANQTGAILSSTTLESRDEVFTPGSTALEVDSNFTGSDPGETDSTLGQSVQSSTSSARSSVYESVEENGRGYHRFKEGKYILPNDEIEQDRLDLQHHLCGLVPESLYLAPLDNLEGGLHNVLDIATGTGIWAIDFAEQFPGAVVKGTDLSPNQHDYVPPNCHFEVDDAEDPWVFSHKFDYIHGRFLVTCFQSHLPVFKSAFDSLRPGGYIEIQDMDPSSGGEKWEGSAVQKWLSMVMEGSRGLGKNWTRVSRYKAMLEELGFVIVKDIVEKKFQIPVGTWARGKKSKTLGLWHRTNLLDSLQGVSMAVLTKGLGMTPYEIEVLLVDVRKDLNAHGKDSLHIYTPMYVIYGRKP